MENLKIEIRKEETPGTGTIMRITGSEVWKTKAYAPTYPNLFEGKIDFVKFHGDGSHVSIVIDNKEISLPKQVLIEALEFLTGTKRIDVN